jgi:hypothetical protein
MSLDIMNHDQAVRSHAAERYLLDELEPAERDAFEGHYFDCTDCFDHIKQGSEFLGLAREVLDREPEPERRWLAGLLLDLRRPAPALVTAMLLGSIGIGTYQQMQIADARKPKMEASFLVPAAQRGAGKLIKVSRKDQLSLSMLFTPSDKFTSYRAQIVDESGAVVSTLPMGASQASDYAISLPASKLRAGKYSLVIEGLTRQGAANKLSCGDFDLKFVD